MWFFYLQQLTLTWVSDRSSVPLLPLLSFCRIEFHASASSVSILLERFRVLPLLIIRITVPNVLQVKKTAGTMKQNMKEMELMVFLKNEDVKLPKNAHKFCGDQEKCHFYPLLITGFS